VEPAARQHHVERVQERYFDQPAPDQRDQPRRERRRRPAAPPPEEITDEHVDVRA
jgi:hypothetical protein